MDALLERLADEFEGVGVRQFPSPLDVARIVEPKTVQTQALDIIDAALIAAENGTGPRRLIISMPPQEGKSQRVSRHFVTWLLVRDPSRRVAMIGYQDRISRRWGKQVRDDITGNAKALGISVRSDSSAANEWQLVGHEGGLITSSVAGSLTGRPVDVMIIDDPHKDAKEAGSEVMQENVRDWWRMVASTRMPAGGGIIVLVQTRWHEADLAGFLLSDVEGGAADWHLINIPAQAVHDPERADCQCGQKLGSAGFEMACLGSDILGRKPGEYMASARGRSAKDWEQRKRNAGSFGWTALYQGWPSPNEGSILLRGWWQYYNAPRWVVRANGAHHAIGAGQVVISVDCAFKDTDGSDYVVLMVLARRGPKVWVLDMVRERMEFEATCDALEQLCAKWPQATLKIVEDKANGPAVISVLRKRVGGIVPFNPTDSKTARARAVSPFVEAGDVSLPSAQLAPWVGGFVHEATVFPNGAHDDQVDAFTQGMHRLLIEGGGGGDFLAAMEAEARQPNADGERDHGGTYWATDYDDGDDGPVPAFAG